MMTMRVFLLSQHPLLPDDPVIPLQDITAGCPHSNGIPIIKLILVKGRLGLACVNYITHRITSQLTLNQSSRSATQSLSPKDKPLANLIPYHGMGSRKTR